MKTILKLEELLQFALGLYMFGQTGYNWWWFWGLLLSPDLGMLGYLGGPRMGAFFYNLFHHKGLALLIWFGGLYFDLPVLQLGGSVLFAHSALDRLMGYGLKYESGFKFTHLGVIGKSDG